MTAAKTFRGDVVVVLSFIVKLHRDAVSHSLRKGMPDLILHPGCFWQKSCSAILHHYQGEMSLQGGGLHHPSCQSVFAHNQRCRVRITSDPSSGTAVASPIGINHSHQRWLASPPWLWSRYPISFTYLCKTTLRRLVIMVNTVRSEFPENFYILKEHPKRNQEIKLGFQLCHQETLEFSLNKFSLS